MKTWKALKSVSAADLPRIQLADNAIVDWWGRTGNLHSQPPWRLWFLDWAPLVPLTSTLRPIPHLPQRSPTKGEYSVPSPAGCINYLLLREWGKGSEKERRVREEERERNGRKGEEGGKEKRKWKIVRPANISDAFAAYGHNLGLLVTIVKRRSKWLSHHT